MDPAAVGINLILQINLKSIQTMGGGAFYPPILFLGYISLMRFIPVDIHLLA
jgi:hypothetical protein